MSRTVDGCNIAPTHHMHESEAGRKSYYDTTLWEHLPLPPRTVDGCNPKTLRIRKLSDVKIQGISSKLDRCAKKASILEQQPPPIRWSGPWPWIITWQFRYP